MKKQALKKGLAAFLGLTLCVQMPSVSRTLQLSAYAQERSATINASSLNVRSGAGTSYSSVGKLARGTAVTVTGEQTSSDGKTWYQIRFTSGGTTQTGYVLSTYVRFPTSYSHDSSFESQLSAQGFPESYKEGLRQIHARYPNWTFTAVKTGLDWNTVIQNEGVLGRNLVHTNSISSYKSLADGAYNWDTGTWTGFDGSTWVAASTEIVSYYMDPRNFLDEVNIFQFLDQTYNASLHTREGLQSMLKGTFMEGNVRTGASASGSSSGSTSGSSSSGSSAGSSSSGSSSVVSGGPGVSIGNSSGSTSATPGSGNSSITSSTPGGSSGSSQSSSGTTSQTPGGQSSDTQVRFQGPSASISKNRAELVTSSVVIGVPPGSSAGNSTSSGNSSGTNTSTTPSGTTSGSTQTPGTSGNTGTTSSGVSYADAIMSAAQSSGVSPYVIAAMILQEQGRNGTGNSISGNYAGYTGYYNYFNVGAYASDGMGAVQRGLWYASQSGTYGRPWTTPEASIAGGAQFYGTNYVKAGQDTLYLKKYNVQGSNIYKHQYMTNVDGAASEGSIFAEGFTAEQKNTALNFKIPVYNNMPDTPCAQPTLSGSPNNKLKGLGVEGFTLTPTFNRDTYSYDLIVDYSVSSVTVNASAIDSKASVRGSGNVSLASGTNEISVVVRAENGTERTYTLHVVRQSGGPTYNAGIGSGVSNGSSSSSSVTIGGPGTSGSSTGNTSSGVITVGPGGSSSGQSTSSSPNSGSSSGSGNVSFSAPGAN